MTLTGGLIIGVVESLAALSPAMADIRTMVPYLVAGLIILWMQSGTTLTFATKD
jgi:branched-subunit amino acid ABC-type transport system permease component